MKHAKEPGQLNSLCGEPVKPYGKARGRVQAIPAHLCWNVSQAKPMARADKAQWCGKCLAGMGLSRARAALTLLANPAQPNTLAEEMATFEATPEDIVWGPPATAEEILSDVDQVLAEHFPPVDK